jgi:hypothetical protein
MIVLRLGQNESASRHASDNQQKKNTTPPCAVADTKATRDPARVCYESLYCPSGCGCVWLQCTPLPLLMHHHATYAHTPV